MRGDGGENRQKKACAFQEVFLFVVTSQTQAIAANSDNIVVRSFLWQKSVFVWRKVVYGVCSCFPHQPPSHDSQSITKTCFCVFRHPGLWTDCLKIRATTSMGPNRRLGEYHCWHCPDVCFLWGCPDQFCEVELTVEGSCARIQVYSWNPKLSIYCILFEFPEMSWYIFRFCQLESGMKSKALWA